MKKIKFNENPKDIPQKYNCTLNRKLRSKILYQRQLLL